MICCVLPVISVRLKSDPNMQPDLSGYDYVLGQQLKPEARTDIVEILLKQNIKPTSMIDISDGLASEIFHICKNSKTSCSVYEDKIPINPTTVSVAEIFKIDSTIAALSGGEDYELLFTISQNDFEKIKEIEDISIIGHITDSSESKNLITRSGTVIPLKAQGWKAM